MVAYLLTSCADEDLAPPQEPKSRSSISSNTERLVFKTQEEVVNLLSVEIPNGAQSTDPIPDLHLSAPGFVSLLTSVPVSGGSSNPRPLLPPIINSLDMIPWFLIFALRVS